jgi:membrane-associated phospholipid phosphatase
MRTQTHPPKRAAATTDPVLSASSPVRVAQQQSVPEQPAVDVLDRRAGLGFAAYKWGLGLLIGVLGGWLYQVMGRTDLHRSVTMLDTALDRAIPLWPWTTWFYQPFYIGIFLIGVLGFRSRFLYNRALICICANVVVGALGHYFIRAAYPRPVLPTPYPDISTWLLAQVHKIDPPGNVFPSLHVAHTFMIAFLLRLDRPRLGKVVMGMAITLALSTLTTKQHFLADVAAGLAMALVAKVWAEREVARAIASAQPLARQH